MHPMFGLRTKRSVLRPLADRPRGKMIDHIGGYFKADELRIHQQKEKSRQTRK